ncbi:MAG TPA: hypothetical protein VHA78_05335 [Candidatus Peribacteraceae bacterium]|nr:hypothetical protein [Candidatus Peribacteraceae bacterium]
MDSPVETPAGLYKDDDLVYVDPLKRIVVGRVEFLQSGKPKALPMKTEEDVEDDAGDEKPVKGKKRPRRQRYYPWGTYRSMKRIYKLEGKIPKVESQKTLDEVIEKALQEPFWD